MADTPTPTLGAAADLPVVAHRFQADLDESHWMHFGPAREAAIKVIGSMGGVVTASEALTPHAPAQSQLDALREEVARLTKERDAANARIDRAVKAAEEVFGIDAIRYKLSLFKNGRARNYFPEHMDGGWFAFQRAEDDAHVGLCHEIVRLRTALAARKEPT